MMKSFIRLFGAASVAAAAEYDAEAKTLKFELKQTTPSPFSTSSYVACCIGAYYTGNWQIGLDLTVGNSNYWQYIVLNDQSTPVMTVDSDNGCPTCTAVSGNQSLWGVGNAGFSMLNSATNYNWIAATNSTYGVSNANVTVNGTQGTVDCSLYMSQSINHLPVSNVPVVAVSNYHMTNTSWWLNEFQFYGSIGFGRPSLTDNTSTSFLTALINNNIISSTTWAYTPSDYTSPGVITVGGVDVTQNNTIYYTATPVNADMPDKWLAPLVGIEMSLGPSYQNPSNDKIDLAQQTVTTVEISTGYQYIGLPTSMWNALCTEYNNFVQIAFPYQYNKGTNNVYCKSTSNVNKLVTMDYDSSLVDSQFNFTIAMNDTAGSTVGYTISMNYLKKQIYNATLGSVYMLPFQDIGHTNKIILGQNWLGGFYTVFDNENAQLGLAIAKNFDTFRGPWIGSYIIPTPPNPKPTPANFTVPLPGLASLIYTYQANVSVGYPAQNATFILANDQGSIMTPALSGCGANCKASPFYVPAWSQSYSSQGEASWNSNDFAASGNAATDQICLGGADGEWNYDWTGFCIPQMPFDIVSSYTPANANVDEFQEYGTFGLGRPNSTVPGNNFIAHAKNANIINSMVYTYEPTGMSVTMLQGPSGNLIIGDYNSSLGNNPIYWVPSPLNVDQPDAWYTKLTQITIDNTNYLNSTFQSPARFMTGFLGIGLNSTLYDSVCNQIKTMNPTWSIYCNGISIYTWNACPTKAWNLTLSFGTGQNFVLSGASLMRVHQNGYPNCYWEFGDIGTNANVVIGSVFIEQFITVFDADNSQLGFAISSSVPQPDGVGPWIYTPIPPNPKPMPANYTVPLSGLIYTYEATVSVGNPPQNATFILANDQGSIMTPALSGCGANCAASPFYVPAWSQLYSSQGEASWNSNDFTASGNAATDQVCFGGADYEWNYDWTGFCIPQMPFDIVSSYAPTNAYTDEFREQGTFGLGRPNANAPSGNFIALAKNAAIIDSTVYAYAPTGTNFNMLHGPSGDILIGGYDSNLFNGAINWVSSPLNVTAADAWYTNMTLFQVKDTSYINSQSYARFMTGVDGIGLNSNLFAEVCSQIQAMSPSATISCSSLYPTASSECPSEAWNLTLSFGTGKNFVLSSASIARQTEDISGAAQCRWLFGNIGASANFVIGSVFFEQFFTVFDADNSQLGFAISSSVPQPDGVGPWIYTPIPPNPKPTPANYTVPLSGLIYSYEATVSVGNPPQNATFILANDQGSIMTPALSGCGANCAASPFFEPALSQSYSSQGQATWNSNDFTASGNAATDQVCFGGADYEWNYDWTGYCIPQMPFDIVSFYAPTNAYTDEFRQQGTFGLGRPNANAPSGNFIALAKNAAIIDSTVYAYAPTGANFNMLHGPSGDILIGGYEQSLFIDAINWVSSPLNVTAADAWYTNVTLFQVKDTSYINTTFSSPARFMTGVDGIGLNSTLFAEVCSQIQAISPSATISCSSLYPSASSACPTEAWNLTLSFGTGKNFVISSASITRQTEDISGAAQCQWLFGNIGDSTSVSIGSVFIEQFFTVFDAENSQVGFAISSVVLQPDGLGPWIFAQANSGGGSSALAVVLIIIGILAVVGVVGVIVVTQMRKKKQQDKADNIAYSSMK